VDLGTSIWNKYWAFVATLRSTKVFQGSIHLTRTTKLNNKFLKYRARKLSRLCEGRHCEVLAVATFPWRSTWRSFWNKTQRLSLFKSCCSKEIATLGQEPDARKDAVFITRQYP
jgi:hypothetical protein